MHFAAHCSATGVIALGVDAIAAAAQSNPAHHIAAVGEPSDAGAILSVQCGGVDLEFGEFSCLYSAIGKSQALYISERIHAVIAISKIDVGDKQTIS